MPSNTDFVLASRAHWGKPYWNKDGTRFGPVHYDCSGHVVASYRECGAGEPPAYVSSTLFTLCRDHGSVRPFSELPEPGELLFMPADPTKGIGSAGHVCMVDLNREMTSEARGTAYGVGTWTIRSRTWAPFLGRLPGIDFADTTPQRNEDDVPSRLRSNRQTMYLVNEATNTAWALTPATMRNVQELDAAAEFFHVPRPLYGRNDVPVSDEVLAGMTKVPVGGLPPVVTSPGTPSAGLTKADVKAAVAEFLAEHPLAPK